LFTGSGGGGGGGGSKEPATKDKPKPSGDSGKVVHKTKDIVKLMADQYEKKTGWTADRTREGFIKNWTRNLKGTQADPASVEKINSAVQSAKEKYNLPDLPVVVRKHADYDAGTGDSYGRWNDGHVIIYPLATTLKGGASHPLNKENAASPTSAYEDQIAATLIHEVGHSLHDEDPARLDRAKALLSDENGRKEISKYLGRYAATAPEEVVAEAYTVFKHPDYKTLPDEAKKLVDHILGPDVK
jgi:hypothetical protein